MSTAAAGSDSPPPEISIVRDAAWAEVLGRTLFWDTAQAMTAAQSDPESTPGDAIQVAQALLARHSLDRYRWLIERAFKDSVWQGPGDARLRANFALIWRLSTRLYESTLQGRPANLRVCRPDLGSDEFKCAEEAEPVRIIPIPSQGPALIPANPPAIG
ncbi:MAG TPA: hypothetical protein VGL55_02985 [Steroidobacteraceae bacterium]|jgi:hypothetical protein